MADGAQGTAVRHDLRLSVADTVIVNAASALCLAPVKTHEALYVDVIREALGRGNPDHPFMAAIVAELRALLAPAAPGLNGGATWRLRAALADFMKWRLGEALERLRTEGEKR